MAKIDGYDVLLTIGEQTLLGQTSTGADFAADMIDITTKDSNKFKEFLAGEKGATITVDTLFDVEGEEVDTAAIFAAYLAGTEVEFQLGDREEDSWYFEGQAHISGLNFNFSKNEAASNSITLQTTGEFDLVVPS
jgi:predicted secreted protein